jgi:hypothetical protein
MGAHMLTAGRAAALFAVLAGVSLVLANHPDATLPLRHGVRRGILARAAFIAAVGLVLAEFHSGIAIILVHYGALFAIGCLFVGLDGRILMVTAGGWLLISPVFGFLVRPVLPPGLGSSPTLASLGEPGDLVSAVLFTGYYPVSQWIGYLLVGMAIAGLRLRRTTTCLCLVGAGLVLAAGSKLLSDFMLGPLGGFGQLGVPAGSILSGRDLETVLQTGTYGTTPTNSWWWLAVSAPHSSAPLDLLHTTGTAIAVIGGCLLVGSALAGRWQLLLLIPVAAVGSMTLTLYSAHVVALGLLDGSSWDPDIASPTAYWVWNVAVALVVATAWQLTGRRGPLESVSAALSASAAEAGRTGQRSGF